MTVEHLDFPTAFAIQRRYGNDLTHHPRCSFVQSAGFLCDCGAVERKWQELRESAAEREGGAE